jgi:hypothetical protein
MAISAGYDILASDFITTSSGVGDSGKVPVLNAAGKIALGFIPSGTDANKIIALDSNAKLPAVDGSQLTNMKIPYKSFGLPWAVQSGGGANENIEASAFDGNYLVLTTSQSSPAYSGKIRAFKFIPETKSFMYLGSYQFSTNGSYLSSYSAVIVGNYFYRFAFNGSTESLFRTDLTNVAGGETQISIPANHPKLNRFVLHDGTYFYISTYNGGSIFYAEKFSLSGTTLSYISSQVITNSPNIGSGGIVGGYVYGSYATSTPFKYTWPGMVASTNYPYSNDAILKDYYSHMYPYDNRLLLIRTGHENDGTYNEYMKAYVDSFPLF